MEYIIRIDDDFTFDVEEQVYENDEVCINNVDVKTESERDTEINIYEITNTESNNECNLVDFHSSIKEEYDITVEDNYILDEEYTNILNIKTELQESNENGEREENKSLLALIIQNKSDNLIQIKHEREECSKETKKEIQEQISPPSVERRVGQEDKHKINAFAPLDKRKNAKNNCKEKPFKKRKERGKRTRKFVRNMFYKTKRQSSFSCQHSRFKLPPPMKGKRLINVRPKPFIEPFIQKLPHDPRISQGLHNGQSELAQVVSQVQIYSTILNALIQLNTHNNNEIYQNHRFDSSPQWANLPRGSSGSTSGNCRPPVWSAQEKRNISIFSDSSLGARTNSLPLLNVQQNSSTIMNKCWSNYSNDRKFGRFRMSY